MSATDRHGGTDEDLTPRTQDQKEDEPKEDQKLHTFYL